MTTTQAQPPRGFWAAAQAEPDRIAVIDPAGREWTAGEIAGDANRLVHALRARGLTAGDPVAMLLPNRAETFVLLMALFQAGWNFVPLNSNLTVAEVAYISRDAGARALVADARFADVAATAAEESGVPRSGRIAVGGADPGRLHPARRRPRRASPTSPPTDRVAGQFMQYTSGTTGRPKAVERALPSFDPEDVGPGLQRQPHSLRHRARWGRRAPGDVADVPHGPVVLRLLLGALRAHGRPHGEVGRRGGAPAHRALPGHRRAHGADAAAPSHAAAPEVRARYDVSSLRQVIHAAAPCPIDLKLRLFEWLGPVIYEFYGATEGGGTLARPEDWLAHPGTVGRPWQGADVKVLDDEGNEVPPGTVGTVYMKLMGGDFRYKGDAEKTDANRHGDFFTVGDMGELDEDGFLYLRDRKIDMIISGGVNIYPAEVEAALLSHPAVGDAAVFGIPNEEWGEEVKAVVEPAAGLRRLAGAGRGAAGALRRPPGQVQVPAQRRLHRRHAAGPQREALQAAPARPVLGRQRAWHLTRAGRWRAQDFRHRTIKRHPP